MAEFEDIFKALTGYDSSPSLAVGVGGIHAFPMGDSPERRWAYGTSGFRHPCRNGGRGLRPAEGLTAGDAEDGRRDPQINGFSQIK